MGRLIIVPIFHSPSEKRESSLGKPATEEGLACLSREYFAELAGYLASVGPVSKVYCDSYLDFSELGEATQAKERRAFFRES